MIYVIIAILIILTNVIMYNVGKRRGEHLNMVKMILCLDPKHMAKGEYDKAFAKLGEEIQRRQNPPQKMTPPPVNKDIIKELDHEYILRNRKTDKRPGHPNDTGRRAYDYSEVHPSSQSDQTRRG